MADADTEAFRLLTYGYYHAYLWILSCFCYQSNIYVLYEPGACVIFFVLEKNNQQSL